jgi:hypothetical protein
VLLTFRGSATLKDLQVDADGTLVECDNPMNPATKLGVHQGFRGRLDRFGINMNMFCTALLTRFLCQIT